MSNLHRARRLSAKAYNVGLPSSSVVISSLQEIDAIGADRIHQAMLFGDSARPRSGENIFKRFWLADSPERISHDCLN